MGYRATTCTAGLSREGLENPGGMRPRVTPTVAPSLPFAVQRYSYQGQNGNFRLLTNATPILQAHTCRMQIPLGEGAAATGARAHGLCEPLLADYR